MGVVTEKLEKLDGIRKATHLGGLIRAVEDYIFQEDRQPIIAEIKKIRDRQDEAKLAGKDYPLEEKDRKVLSEDMSGKIFHISLHKTRHLANGKGFNLAFDNGVILNYFENCPTELETHFIICHELAHIVLHLTADENKNRYFPSLDDAAEAEADDFAVRILQRLRAQLIAGEDEDWKSMDFENDDWEKAGKTELVAQLRKTKAAQGILFQNADLEKIRQDIVAARKKVLDELTAATPK